jgi:hypothetical protein
MSITKTDLDRFHDFAVSLVSAAESDVTWLQLFELWRMENPSDAEYRENVAAMRESLQAMEAGRMRPLADFDAEFRKRHGIKSDA